MFKVFTNEEFREVKLKDKLKLRYAISNFGRLVSFTDKIEDGNLLKGATVKGYKIYVYNTRVNGEKVRGHFLYHRAIGELFLEKESEGHAFVIHLDYNKQNNHVSNLKWVTKREMELHQQKSPYVIAARKKRAATPAFKGQKLTATKVMLIKKRIFNPNRKTRMKVIAKQFNISEMQLYRIKSGENWSHVKI